MVLRLDIQKKAAAIIKQVYADLQQKHADQQLLNDNLGDFILQIEGFQNHVFSLAKEDAKVLLDETSRVIAEFIEIEEGKSDFQVSGDTELTERFRYGLKALFKLRSLLHLVYTKDIAVVKTDSDLKNGLSGISRTAAKHIVNSAL